MQPKIAVMLLFAVLASMYAIGFLFSEDCFEVAGCRSCWREGFRNITSEFCQNPGVACYASSDDQRHNAFVQTMACACEITATANYQNADLNSQIQQKVKTYFGLASEPKAQDICESQSTVNSFLRYRKY